METACTGPRNVIAIIILVSDAITVLLLLKPGSEPSDGVQQPQAVLWGGWLQLAKGQFLTANAAQELVHSRMAGCVSSEPPRVIS